jgi:hypothetical protein
MSRSSRSFRLMLFTTLATCGLGACGKRASGETATASGKAGRPPSACPSVEQVSQAAGFPVTFTQAIGTNPDTWMGCQWEMTGRSRGTFIMLTGEPAANADSIYAEMKQAVKAINGQEAEADRLDLGSGGWAFGSEDSRSAAAAVIGSHVYHAELGYSGLGTIGNQKDAMVRVLKLMAH